MSSRFEIKMLCRTYCGTCLGVDAVTVTIEVDVTPGISFYLVGLPDSAVRESQQRITTALQSIGCKIPGRRIVINMAPADLKKEGSAYDLAIAAGIICASGQHEFPNIEKFMIMGELALDGSIRPVRGVLPVAEHARKQGFAACLFPIESAAEALEIEGIEIYGVHDLEEVVSILLGEGRIEPLSKVVSENHNVRLYKEYDFCDIKGQSGAKRAMEVAAAGAHHILMNGSPGTGKSFLAKALPSILPLMNRDESVETSKIYSVAGGGQYKGGGLIKERPFRSPHHSSSIYALTGGGVNSLPGEISLAHNGVLYLDEIAEFPKHVLEILRQPLEDRQISISRMKYKITYPSNFMLVASMNPCPCGYYGENDGRCVCSPFQVARYVAKLSGPLIDRIDIHIEVNNVPAEMLLKQGATEEQSERVRERVSAARDLQKRRFGSECNTNSQMNQEHLKRFCSLGRDEQSMLSSAVNKLNMSARSYTRILKVARTIADLDNSTNIKTAHLAEAIQYRRVR